jgi:dihydropteroate synthase
MPAERIVFADGGTWELAVRTHVLGILNVTPDSFSDGGCFLDEGRASEHAASMIAEGADGVDIGGQSTRPGSEPVTAQEERRRLVPVLARVRRENPRARISVDTTRAAIAREALDLGADMINDISGMMVDPGMPATVARSGAACVLMHIRETPRTMQDNPVYEDLIGEILRFLERAVERAVAAGVNPDGIAVDPGIGFGKTVEHNVEILRRLPEFRRLGRPILVGVSRKSFIGALSGAPVEGRFAGSLGAGAVASLHGASILRAHDVGGTVQMLRVVDALARG